MSLVEPATTSPRAIIEARTLGVIEVALLSHARDVHVGAGAKRLAAQATTEYHDRFLIELVQNAHDAHPPTEGTGEIEVLFAREEGQFGTLYVANGGRPFSTSNFKTICEIGLSDKLPGEAIGNKGIGFKSVLQICDRPEIYSADPDLPTQPRDSFDGFCFSFATNDQLLERLEGDAGKFAIVRGETATFHLPVPLNEHPHVIKTFAQRGFATVIRLPLEREGAIDELDAELNTLRAGSAPLLLFLSRLQHLAINETGAGAHGRVDLFRDAKQLTWPDAGGIDVSRVDLREHGRYLCASVSIEGNEVAEVIASAVEAHELEETWLGWREEAVVSAAVRIDAPAEQGSLYTYLPMEVSSPFAGHLNAPFYARLDRRDLNRGLSLNSLLLDAGARACRLAAQAIADRNDRDLAGALVDIFAWDPSEAVRLEDALGEAEPASQAAVLPVIAANGRAWGSLGDTYLWDGHGRRVFTTDGIARAADVHLADPGIGNSRLDRLEQLHSALMSRDMTPTHEELAVWSERIAEMRPGRRPGISWWNSFYDELAELFEHEGGHLEGRRILLDEESQLRAAGTSGDGQHRTPTVFFQPVRERAEGLVDIDAADDVRIPKTLRRSIVFLNPRLEWLERVGNTRRKKRSRVFLEECDLVKPYAARSLLEHLRDLLQESRSKAVSQDALRMAFRLQRTRDYDQRPALRDLRLRVPCRGGWVAAESAHFSASWPGTMGDALERLINLSGGASSEFLAVERKLLLPPDEWPLSVNAAEWTEFLHRAGVRDGLWPITSRRTRAQERGSSFTPETVGKQVGLPNPVLSSWVKAVEQDGQAPQHLRGIYRNRAAFYVLPGQADYKHLPDRARSEYAALVAASCGQWSDDHFSIRIQRSDVSSYNLDPFSWPSPVTAFFESEEWLPMSTPQARDKVNFVCLREAWHFTERSTDGDEYAQPDYAPLIPLRLRRALDARPLALERLRKHGLNVWNEPADAARLVQHLGWLVQSDAVTDQYVANVRRAYEQAWDYALEAGTGAEAAASARFVVTRSGQLDAFDPTADAKSPLYVHDGGSGLADSLLRLSSRALIDVDERVGENVAKLLRERLGPRVHRTSEERLVVMDAGNPVVPDDSGPLLLTADLAWLDGLVMAVLELRRGAFRKLTGPVREGVMQTLRAVRLRFASQILLQVGSEALPPPQAMREGVPLPDERNPTLIVRGTGPILSWAQLEAVLPALADLIRYAELAPAMQFAVRRLAPGDRELPVSAPSVREIADALDEPEQRVREVIRGLRGSAAALLDLLAPALLVLLGPDEYERFAAEAHELDDEEDLLRLVTGLELAVPPEDLRAVTRGEGTVDDVRRALGISLADANSALRALGRPPIDYTEEHAHVFAMFVGTHHEEALRRLRQAYLPLFRSGAALDTYVAARDGLRVLGPNPVWLDEHEAPPETVMQGHLDEWLEAATAELQPADEAVKPLDVVQRDNRGLLRELLGRAQRTVLAWTYAHDRDAPELWNRADLELAVWDALLAEGQTDFDPIDTERLAGWLANNGDWPEGMPQTLSLDDLELTQEEVERAKTEEERERAHGEFLRRSIDLGGTRHSAAQENYAALAEAVRASVTLSVLRTRAGFSDLAEPPVRVRRGTAPTGPRVASPRPTEAQRGAIGLVGEVVALEWLKRRYSGARDDSWKSGYRNFVLGGALGNDSLGFDFEVPVGRTSYFFEVKATSGDDMQIELGESEVLAARHHARTDRYRILYIPSALDIVRRSIHVLPNPFAERGRDLYQLEGSGLRYRFQLDQRS